MALRFTVQGDTEAETARRPVDTIGNGWMARAVPRMTKAPAGEGRGLGGSS